MLKEGAPSHAPFTPISSPGGAPHFSIKFHFLLNEGEEVFFFLSPFPSFPFFYQGKFHRYHTKQSTGRGENPQNCLILRLEERIEWFFTLYYFLDYFATVPAAVGATVGAIIRRFNPVTCVHLITVLHRNILLRERLNYL